MPIDVSALITGAAYDPVVQCAADGEVHTQALIVDPLVALGNRTEYLRKLVELKEFTNTEIRDDFHLMQVTTNGFTGDSGPWNAPSVGNFSTMHASARNADHVGGVQVIVNAGNCAFYKDADAYAVSKCEKMTCHVWINSSTFNSGFEFGLSGGSSNVVNTTGVNAWTIQWHKATNATNWLFRTGNTGGNTQQNSGIAVTFGAWNRLELEQNMVTGDLKFSVNGSPQFTAVSNLPTVSTLLTPIVRSNGTSSSDHVNVDAVYWRFRTPGRV